MSAILKGYWAKLGATGRHSSIQMFMVARAFELGARSGEMEHKKLLLVTVFSTTFAARITVLAAR